MKTLYNTYFPTPDFLVMTSCALDISDQSIKYGMLSSSSSGLELERYGKERIPPGVVVSGKIENPSALSAILVELRKREHLHFVRVSLPEEQVYLFTMPLPTIAESDLREAILLQMEEHIPLAAVDAVFDYDVISRTSSTIVVQVAAIARSTITDYLAVFKASGLVPLSFELEAQAVARAVVERTDPSSVMIVDFGETRTGISIADRGRVLFTSTFNLGGMSLTGLIAKSFSISMEEAEKMKLTYNYKAEQTPEMQEIFSVILNSLSVLRDELDKHCIYWHTHPDDAGVPHTKINRIILCGGDSNLAELSNYLQSSMKIPTVYANAWVNTPRADSTVPAMSFEESLAYGTVIGLALGDYVYE